MSVRPDLVECWIFRVPSSTTEPEFLLIRRAADRIFPGLWQPVTGGLEPGEAAPATARREVAEETGLAGADIEALYDLDQVGSFYAEDAGSIVSSVIFAIRIRPDARPGLSSEHDGLDWVDGDRAVERSVWPPYRESIERIRRLVADPAWAAWFELDGDGLRIARRPKA